MRGAAELSLDPSGSAAVRAGLGAGVGSSRGRYPVGTRGAQPHRVPVPSACVVGAAPRGQTQPRGFLFP